MTDLRELLYEPWCPTCNAPVCSLCRPQAAASGHLREKPPIAYRMPEAVTAGLTYSTEMIKPEGWYLDATIRIDYHTAELMFIGNAVKLIGIGADIVVAGKGELADRLAAALHAVPMDGCRRDMTCSDTGLPWVAPPPNMPTMESALAYPGTCLFEGTPLSVGRGTERAFQWVGAPWLDGPTLAESLNAYGLKGVRFEAVDFTPTDAGDGKFEGQQVQGVRLVQETTNYDAPKAAVAMLLEAYGMSGDNWSWSEDHFDRLAGTDLLRLGIEAGQDFAALTAAWDEGVRAFEQLRRPYLIY